MKHINFPKEKLFFKISEVAEIFSVKVSTIRFWENEFDILKPKKIIKEIDYSLNKILKISRLYITF